MPDILHQDKHVQTASTAYYCGREVRVVCYFYERGVHCARIEFSDRGQLTVPVSQIQPKAG